jgi:hypothetical protein
MIYEITIGTTHLKRSSYKKQLQGSKNQVLLAQMQQESGIRNEFFKDLCSAMVAADIPWYKIQVPNFRSFLEKYCKRHVPDESTFHNNYLNACYQLVNPKVHSVLSWTPHRIKKLETTGFPCRSQWTIWKMRK